MTSVADFRKALASKSAMSGSQWLKVDFHVHCPGSSDYEYKGSDRVERLGAELASGRHAAAIIVKHEEFPSRQELAEIGAHCPETILIPGAEINVFVETLFKKVSKDHYFHCILAVDPGSTGDYGYVLQRAKQELTYTKGDHTSGFQSSTLDVGRFFRQQGALFLAAHLHQSREPERSKSIDDIYEDDVFLRFVEGGAFTALEVRQQSTAEFFTGDKTTREGRLIPRAVCVQSSDAHSHTHIAERNRHTWVQMEKATYAELSTALAFPHRVSLQRPPLAQQRIIGVHIAGAFLQDMWLSLNPGMNCFIGCKGSGKTSVLECLRFLFGTAVPQDRRESVSRHVTHILGSSGVVESLVQRPDGQHIVCSRRADSPQRLKITFQDGTSRDVASAGEFFELSILGWHEIEAVADSPPARIQLVDRVSGGPKVLELYLRIDREIEQARDNLPLLQQRLKRLNEALGQLWDLMKKRDALARLEKAELLQLQNQYEWFLRAEEKILGHRKRLELNKVALSDLMQFQLEFTPAVDLGEPIPDRLLGVLQITIEALVKLRTSDAAVRMTLDSSRDEVLKSLDAARASIAEDFARFRDTVYNPRVQELPPEDREVLTRQIQILEETRLLSQKEEECKTLHAEVVKLAEGLENICRSICDSRNDVCATRERTIQELNQAVEGVRLTFQRSGNKSRLDTYKQKYAREAGAFVSLIQEYGKEEVYENLKSLFASLRQTDITANAWKVKDLMWDVKLVDFLSVVDDDDVLIALNVGKAGFVPIQNLSAGQRCTAVFPLLLRNSRGPLVIDQPEDNLDNRHIADTIAPDLLRRKLSQQYIVTSHNANLVVLTDADLIVQMDSDGAQGKAVQAGFLACPQSHVRKCVLDVLDGGEAALEARRRKYGLSSST
jgi:DNA repair ATPase RecN